MGRPLRGQRTGRLRHTRTFDLWGSAMPPEPRLPLLLPTRNEDALRGMGLGRSSSFAAAAAAAGGDGFFFVSGLRILDSSTWAQPLSTHAAHAGPFRRQRQRQLAASRH